MNKDHSFTVNSAPNYNYFVLSCVSDRTPIQEEQKACLKNSFKFLYCVQYLKFMQMSTLCTIYTDRSVKMGICAIRLWIRYSIISQGLSWRQVAKTQTTLTVVTCLENMVVSGWRDRYHIDSKINLLLLIWWEHRFLCAKLFGIFLCKNILATWNVLAISKMNIWKLIVLKRLDFRNYLNRN